MTLLQKGRFHHGDTENTESGRYHLNVLGRERPRDGGLSMFPPVIEKIQRTNISTYEQSFKDICILRELRVSVVEYLFPVDSAI
jgi:hypothetical protein